MIGSACARSPPPGLSRDVPLPGAVAGKTLESRGGAVCCVLCAVCCVLCEQVLQTMPAGEGLPLDLLKDYGRQILVALRYLSKLNIVHNDMKIDNMLLSVKKSRWAGGRDKVRRPDLPGLQRVAWGGGWEKARWPAAILPPRLTRSFRLRRPRSSSVTSARPPKARPTSTPRTSWPGCTGRRS